MAGAKILLPCRMCGRFPVTKSAYPSLATTIPIAFGIAEAGIILLGPQRCKEIEEYHLINNRKWNCKNLCFGVAFFGKKQSYLLEGQTITLNTKRGRNESNAELTTTTQSMSGWKTKSDQIKRRT